MYKSLAVVALLFTLIACDHPCPTGLACVRSCPPSTRGVCNVDGLCLCRPADDEAPSGPMSEVRGATMGDHGSGCKPVEPNDILISEVLIDGEPDETAEFIEIVSRRDVDIDLAGVSIWSNRGDRMLRRIGFLGGCLPPHGAIALYEDETSWRIVPEMMQGLNAHVGRFGFSNSAPFRFEIRDREDRVIDQVAGAAELIRPGVSIQRLLDVTDVEPHLIHHNALQPGKHSSPGFCPNGGRYDMSCLDVDDPDYGCAEPEVGNLVINEVLIDGRDSEDEEFVELINATPTPVSLVGLDLWSNRGGGMARRLSIFSGCLPSLGAVSFWQDAEQTTWKPMPETPIEVDIARFGFPNKADFRFELRNAQGLVLDTFAGPKQMIRPGTSINRLPDVSGRVLGLHRVSTSSPSLCMNGNSFEDGCSADVLESSTTERRVLQRPKSPWTLAHP